MNTGEYNQAGEGNEENCISPENGNGSNTVNNNFSNPRDGKPRKDELLELENTQVFLFFLVTFYFL